MSSRHVFAKASLMVACLTVGLAAQAKGAVVAPYSPADMTDFTKGATGSGSTWTSTFEDNLWDGVGGSTGTAVVDTTGVAGQNFTVKTDLQVKSWGGSALISGLVALAQSENIGGDWSNTRFYAATLRFDGSGQSLDISTNNPSYYGTSLVTGGGKPVAWAAVNGTYALTMNGVYDASGNLTLSATLVDKADSANTLTVTTPQIAAADISSGTMFGLRDAGYWGGGDVQYGNFSINASVPEPASMGLLGLGGLSLLARRRKSA